MDWNETALPPEMESVRRRLVRSHNIKALALTVLVFGGLIYWVTAFPVYKHANDPMPEWLISHAPLFLATPFFLGFAVIIELRDRALSRKWGFVCPHCGEPLYKAESIYWPAKTVRLTGACPKCHQRVF
jgi:hypothetical protein